MLVLQVYEIPPMCFLYTLAANERNINRIIGDVVIGPSDIDHRMVLDQLQTLIAAPLDACLRDHKYRAPSRVRLLMSHPEHHIKQALRSQPQVFEHDLYLIDKSAQGDIALSLSAKLPLIPHRLGIPAEAWPPDEDVQTLQRSQVIFSYSPNPRFDS